MGRQGETGWVMNPERGLVMGQDRVGPCQGGRKTTWYPKGSDLSPNQGLTPKSMNAASLRMAWWALGTRVWGGCVGGSRVTK